MLVHVTAEYDRTDSPVHGRDGEVALATYAEWMDAQTEFSGVKKVAVYFGTESPVGFGIFETEDKAELEAYLSGLPGSPSITLSPVELVSDSVARVWGPGSRADS